MLDGFDNKAAHAVTTIGYADSQGKYHTFQGVTHGKIVPSRGPTDFGWDSIFQPDESNGLTYAEMQKEDKNKISQRGRAFAQLKIHLDSTL